MTFWVQIHLMYIAIGTVVFYAIYRRNTKYAFNYCLFAPDSKEWRRSKEQMIISLQFILRVPMISISNNDCADKRRVFFLQSGLTHIKTNLELSSNISQTTHFTHSEKLINRNMCCNFPTFLKSFFNYFNDKDDA